MLHYALLLVVLACSFSGLTIGGKHYKKKCDRLLPDNRVGRQDYLDKVSAFISFKLAGGSRSGPPLENHKWL